MNIRSLMRGDGVVMGAALLLFIASFLDVASAGGLGSNAWDNLGLAMSMYVGGVIGAALIVLSRSSSQPRKVAGLDIRQFGIALTVFAAWTGLWTVIDFGGAPGVTRGTGLVLGFIATLILAFGAVGTPLVPGLQAPLVPVPKPQPYAAGAGYGYPGVGGPAYGTQGGGAYGMPAPAGAQGGAEAPASAAPPGFAPFWFAVPVARPLYGEDGSPSPITELAPGTWYLAVEQRGAGLVAQTQDGRRGVLQDTTGIQRG